MFIEAQWMGLQHQTWIVIVHVPSPSKARSSQSIFHLVRVVQVAVDVHGGPGEHGAASLGLTWCASCR